MKEGGAESRGLAPRAGRSIRRLDRIERERQTRIHDPIEGQHQDFVHLASLA